MNWTSLNDAERRLVLDGQIIPAIKSLRNRLNCGLREAKDACDDYRRRTGWNGPTAAYNADCVHSHTFIKVNSPNEDAVVCKGCGAFYRRA